MSTKEMNRFHQTAITFSANRLAPSAASYTTTVHEDTANGGDDPSKRLFKVTFSQPTPSCPVPDAVAAVFVRVWYENRNYAVKGYFVEGKKQLLPEDFPFNLAWIERVIRTKRSMKEQMSVENDEFLRTRLGGSEEGKHESGQAAADGDDDDVATVNNS